MVGLVFNENPGALAGDTGANFDLAGAVEDSPAKGPKATRYPAQERWRQRNRMARWAQAATRSAIYHGLIEKQPCVVCGDPKAEAHHPSYNDPLHPEWRCRAHHKALHAEMRRAAK